MTKTAEYSNGLGMKASCLKNKGGCCQVGSILRKTWNLAWSELSSSFQFRTDTQPRPDQHLEFMDLDPSDSDDSGLDGVLDGTDDF